MIKVGSGERVNGVQQNGNNLLVFDLRREKRSNCNLYVLRSVCEDSRRRVMVAEGELFGQMKFVDVVIMPLHVHFGFPAHMNQATPTAPPTAATASMPHLRLSTPAAPVWSPGFDDCVPVAGDCCPPVSVPVALAPTYA